MADCFIRDDFLLEYIDLLFIQGCKKSGQAISLTY